MVGPKDIGHRVADSAGRLGILRDVIRDYEDPADPPGDRRKRPTAFIWPEGGGREWTAPPASVARA